jgi:hypothetical protein
MALAADLVLGMVCFLKYKVNRGVNFTNQSAATRKFISIYLNMLTVYAEKFKTRQLPVGQPGLGL